MKTTYEPALAVSGLTSFSVVISDDAQKRKDDALALSAAIKTVTTAQEQQDAIAAASLLKGLVKGMETTRVEVVAPIIAAKREADDCARLYSGTLEKELKRVEALAADYQRKQNAIADAARREQERIAREAEAAAEADRRKHLAAIAAAKNDAAREEARRVADIAAEANAEAARARQQIALTIAPAKAEGARVDVKMDYEVLNIAAMYAARPDLVELKERRALILAAIAIPGVTIPGIRIFESTKLHAKASL